MADQGSAWRHGKYAAGCLFQNTIITLGIVGLGLGVMTKYKSFRKLKPLMLFGGICITGDLIHGYCITCRTEVNSFWEAYEAEKRSKQIGGNESKQPTEAKPVDQAAKKVA
jgi:hypothetical protein